MSFEVFNPKKRELSSIKSWTIKPHINRTSWRGFYDQHIPVCADCKRDIQYGDLAFRCITSPVRIRPHGYDKVCLVCGMKILQASVPKRFLDYFHNHLLSTLQENK